jgi:prolipoprotein diacylglyceryl transferase
VSQLVATIPPPPFRGEDGMTSFDIGPLSVAAYGLLIAVGAYLGLRLLVSRYERAGGDPELAERTALLAIGAGLLGARIGYVIPRTDHFFANPQEILAIWQGGLAFFGGVALALVVCIWYVRSRGGDLPAMADAAAPALPLAQAIGRWGNYFNQELYGRPTDLPWALEVEPHRRVAGFQDATTFHPTFLYESLWNLTLVALLLWIDRRRVEGRRWLRRGSLGFLYLIGYGVGRFWTELLRIDTAERYFGMSRNNWVALAVTIAGVLGLLWWERRGRSAADEASDDATDDATDGTTNDADDVAPDDATADTPDPSTDEDGGPPAASEEATDAAIEDDATDADGSTGGGPFPGSPGRAG